ncbi:MAG: hypothetical protein HYY08_04245 [Firmicutes bacterium]|nr:hypothetical protein [Bacillota bacterium]
MDDDEQSLNFRNYNKRLVSLKKEARLLKKLSENGPDPWLRPVSRAGTKQAPVSRLPVYLLWGFPAALALAVAVAMAFVIPNRTAEPPERPPASITSPTVKPLTLWLAADLSEEAELEALMRQQPGGGPSPPLRWQSQSDLPGALTRSLYSGTPPDLAVVESAFAEHLRMAGLLLVPDGGEFWLPLGDRQTWARPLGIVILKSTPNPTGALALARYLERNLRGRGPRPHPVPSLQENESEARL